MSPRETYGVVMRSFGLACVLYGVYTILQTIIGAVAASSFVSSMNEVGPFSLHASQPTTSLTGRVLAAGIVSGLVVMIGGRVLMRGAEKYATFKSTT